MADLKKIALDLSEFSKSLKSNLDDVILSNMESLKTVILDRLRKGVTDNGGKFPAYSEVKVSASRFESLLSGSAPSPAKSFINKAIDENKSISYRDVRGSAGFNNDTYNFSFTDNMFKSVRVSLKSKSEGVYTFVITPNNPKDKEKLIANEDRISDEILSQSDEENKNVIDDVIKDIIDKFNTEIG